MVPETKETQKRLFDDSMFKLEHGSKDISTAESAKPRLLEIYNRNESVWADSYSANQRLRQVFRVSNKNLRNYVLSILLFYDVSIHFRRKIRS